jgi:hypothetical protein
VRKLIVLLALLFVVAVAHAQSIGGNVSIAVGATTGRVALPASTTKYPAILIAPAVGTTNEIFYALGGSTVTATSSSPALPAAGLCFFNVGPTTYVAAIAPTGSPNLRITQMSQCPVLP